MDRKGLSFVTLLVSATLLSGASSAEFGTTEEARGLLERAVTAVKKDPAAAIRSFNYNAEPFRDRDLFVFCFNGRDGSSRHTRLSSDGTCARCAMPIASPSGRKCTQTRGTVE